MRHSLRVLAFLLVAGCGEDGHRLIVQARTDLTPGVDFVTVRVSLDDPPVSEVIPAVIGQDFITPARITELDLPAGSYSWVVSAVDAAGREVVSRRLRVDLREDLAVTATLFRSCEGVVCPRAGDVASLSTCAGGRCVDPSCFDLEPAQCVPGECSTDAECIPAAPCHVGMCIEGGCLFAIDDTCMPDAGTDGGVDGGIPDAPIDAPRDVPVDTRPTCVSEELLASSAPQDETGGFSGAFSSLVVVLTGDPGGAEIGAEDRLPSGYTGAREFRAGDDADFDAVVSALMAGSAPRTAVKAPVGGGAYTGVSLSNPVAGRLITMVRRDVESLTFTNSGGRTDYDATVSWELWGCDP